jgi:hypothetical protein
MHRDYPLGYFISRFVATAVARGLHPIGHDRKRSQRAAGGYLNLGAWCGDKTPLDHARGDSFG